jgi:biotin carboxyl carrier protein
MGYIARIGDREIPVQITGDGPRYNVRIGDRTLEIDAARPEEHLLSLILDGRSYQADVQIEENHCAVLLEGQTFEFELYHERRAALGARRRGESAGARTIRTQMPGKIVRILVDVGAEVEKNQPLIVVEAMKMENEMRAPKRGVVKKIGVNEGEAVEAGTVLVVVE